MAATASSRRILSLWCSRWAVELLCRRHRPDAAPLALIASVQGVPRVVACGRSAEAAGVQPGMALADARAVVPGLRVFPDAPKRRAKALAGLAEWATRFTPWAATDGEDGLMLDVTGCAHLFGGEAALLDRLLAGLETLGFGGRAALSATAGAAWAVARFGGEAAAVVSEGGDRAALLPLPVAALRLPPTVVSGLGRLGLRTVGDLLALPRGPLADRFGPVLGDRIDRALGTAAEPVSPRRPVAPFLVQRAFADPILTPDSITAVLDDLLGELCAVLGARGRGVRRLDLRLFRVDRGRRTLSVGTGRAVRDPRHLARLFAESLPTIDPGFGIEVMRLEAAATDALPVQQIDFSGQVAAEDDVALVVDRVVNRLGAVGARRYAAAESYWPERAAVAVAPLASPAPRTWLARPRPPRLFPTPEPIEAMAMLPDAPPVLFRWRGRRHRVRRAEGPERLSPEWWRDDARARDYYRVEDETGARFWLYRDGLVRDGDPPRWYMHGLLG